MTDRTSFMNSREHFFRAGPLLCVVLGIAHGAGANTPRFAWLQALALVGALLVCFRAARARRSGISAMSALTFAIASATAAHPWLGATLTDDDALGLALGCCVFAALMIGMAILPAASIAVASALVTKDSSRWFAPFALALFYPLSEMATAELVGFGWHATGYAWVETPLAMLLPTIGIYGVGALIVLLCAWLASAIESWARMPALVLSGVVIALAIVGRPNHLTPVTPVSSEVRTRLVQTDLPMHQKFDSAALGARVSEIVALVGNSDAELIVTPETAIPVAWLQLPQETAPFLEPGRRATVAALPRRDVRLPRGRRAAQRVQRTAGQPGSLPPPRYAKRRLVPVAEFSPPGLAWIADLLALPYDDRVTDDSPKPSFAVAGTRVENTICLDLAYPGDLADTASITGIIVNQSNFAAFAGERVREQFLTIARARAIEHAKPVVIASNSGPTAAIGADGEILARLPSHGAASLDVSIRPGEGSTPYATYGESSGSWRSPRGIFIAALLRGRAAESSALTIRAR